MSYLIFSCEHCVNECEKCKVKVGMEPMTLGSPVGSPTPQSSYLPGFLMGDQQPQPTSPAKTPRQVHFAPSLSASSAMSPPTPASATLNENLSRFHKNQREKSGGPPTVGLFDTLEVSTMVSVASPSTSYQAPTLLSQSQHITTMTPATPTQHSQQGADEAERWVTVFGFPPATATSILAQFAQVGHIIEHRFPGQGNWVNICYSSCLDAHRALAYNGKLFGHTMIGVLPCKDLNGGNVLKDMTNVLSPSGCGTPLTPKSPQMSRAVSQHRLITSPTSSPFLGSPKNVRKLGVSSPAPEVVSQSTPTKSTSLMSKAYDFVLGW